MGQIQLKFITVRSIYCVERNKGGGTDHGYRVDAVTVPEGAIYHEEQNPTRRPLMGSMKLNLCHAPYSLEKSVEKFFDTAFGPSPAIYRRVSLCGWRPLSDAPERRYHAPERQESEKAIGSPGISVYETAERMTIEVALTVIKEESLHLAISDKKLIIRGERIPAEHRCRSFTVRRNRGAQFQQMIPLPKSVSAGGFRAQLKGDIVQIEFAKLF